MSEKNVSSSTPYFPKCRPPLGAHLLRNNMSDITDNGASPVTTDPGADDGSKVGFAGEHAGPETSPPVPAKEKDEWEDVPTTEESEDEDDNLDDCNCFDEPEDFARNDFDHQKKPTVNTDPEPTIWLYISIFAIFLMLTAVTSKFVFSPVSEHRFPISAVTEMFPNQSDMLWWVLTSGTDDVIKFQKPATTVWLYEEKAADTVERLLNITSRYIQCKIRHCLESPIVVTPEYLNSPEVVYDYGVVLSKYREPLIKQGLMIVKHLEEVHGLSSLAFHSLCDEVSPLVPDSFFIFTMKVDKVEKYKIRQLETILREQWADLKVDMFHPLFTRISSMVVEVKPNL